jgi:hypothetical protein
MHTIAFQQLRGAYNYPSQHRTHENTGANRDGVHDKIAEAPMSTGNRQMSKLDTDASRAAGKCSSGSSSSTTGRSRITALPARRDAKTIPVRDLEARFGLKRIVFIGDSGMVLQVTRWNVVRLPISGTKSFGIFSRDTGQSRVLAPPHRITGVRHRSSTFQVNRR